jgi:L-asparaginase/Glu-tRNA(Gln) amidotransferase subunit D
MKYCLENYKIYHGGDMTCEAALAKLAYLIGKGYPEEHIIKMMQINLRGEMTE